MQGLIGRLFKKRDGEDKQITFLFFFENFIVRLKHLLTLMLSPFVRKKSWANWSSTWAPFIEEADRIKSSAKPRALVLSRRSENLCSLVENQNTHQPLD